MDFLDLTLFLNPIYTNICIGISLAMCADVTFVTIQSTYLRSILFSNDETAQIMSIGVAADLSSRLLLTVVSSPLKIKARPLFLVGTIVTIALLLGQFETILPEIVLIFHSLVTAFLFVRSFVAVSIITALLGFFRAWYHVPISLVYADLLPAER